MAENQLPKGWVESNMGEVFEMAYGKGLKTSNLTDEGFPVYGANGIIGNYTKYHFDEPQVIISCRGAASGAIHTTVPKAFVTSNSIVLKNRSDENFNQKFTAYYLKSVDKTEIISGTAQPQITIQNLNKLSFKFPPLAEQQRIVAKLDKLFAHLEETKTRLNKIPQLLKNFRQSVLTQAVTGKLTEDWRKENKISIENYSNEVKLNSFKPKEKLEEIVVQDDYLTTPLGKIISIKSGDSLSAKNRVDGKIPVYGGNGITGFHNSFNTTKRTVVIGRVGFYCGSIHITPNEAWITDNAFKVSFSKEILDLDFLSLLLKDANLREVSKSTAQPVISGGKVYPFRVKLFSQKEQIQIVKRYNEVIQLCEKIETRYTSLNKQLGNLPQSILTKAFKGELVQQLPTDGDAQELLNEIQKLKAQTTKKKKK